MTQPSRDPLGLAAPARLPLVFVTVGGDHHPFDRLMRWMDGWLADHAGACRCVVQHATAEPPRGAAGSAFLSHEELQRLIRASAVVVSSGGPATLSECLQAGVRPIVVPRLSGLREAVDDHQRDFCRRMARLGLSMVAEDRTTLDELLDMCITEPGQARLDGSHARAREVDRSVAAIAALIDAKAPKRRRASNATSKATNDVSPAGR